MALVEQVAGASSFNDPDGKATASLDQLRSTATDALRAADRFSLYVHNPDGSVEWYGGAEAATLTSTMLFLVDTAERATMAAVEAFAAAQAYYQTHP